jgi:hypothetical protein
MQDQSSKSAVCLPTREGAKRLLLHFGSRNGGEPKGREQRQGEAGGGGTEQVRVEVGVASSEQRRDGNGLVRLELRGVAAGVPVAAWQLASEGVHVRECARAHGCKQMHPVSSTTKRWRLSAAGVDKGGAPRGGDTILRTKEHGRERLAQRWFGQEDRDLAWRWCARACVRQRRIAAGATPQVARDGSTASAS